MNLTTDEVGVNSSDYMANLVSRMREDAQKELYMKEYWFFDLVMTKLTPYTFCGIAILGLFANSLVVIGEFD